MDLAFNLLLHIVSFVRLLLGILQVVQIFSRQMYGQKSYHVFQSGNAVFASLFIGYADFQVLVHALFHQIWVILF